MAAIVLEILLLGSRYQPLAVPVLANLISQEKMETQ